MTDTLLLATKLQIPTPRPGAVTRAHLLAELSRGLARGHRLTLVSAPPGFGKTTLVRSWLDTVGRPVAWLLLDAHDDDPAQFVRYLVAALRQADDRIGASLPPDKALAPQAVLVHLINDLVAAAEPMLLVLDDYYTVRAGAVHALVADLLSHQPTNLHIVIATREDPPLPLARLRARDLISDVRQRELRFGQAEAQTFYAETMDLGLSQRAVQILTERTEGWITGLQLAGLALRRQADKERFVADFGGDDRYVVDYLMAEVLRQLPPELRTFMRQTAVLEPLCAPLCNAVTGRDDAQALLEQLDRANLFLVPLDRHRGWYRYHALLADVLRLSLSPKERDEIASRAKSWYQSQQAQTAIPAGPVSRPHGPVGVSPAALIEPLSEREREVLSLIVEGLSNAEIAQRLYIALGTVKRHINNIYGKMGVASRTQAIAMVHRTGLLPG